VDRKGTLLVIKRQELGYSNNISGDAYDARLFTNYLRRVLIRPRPVLKPFEQMPLLNMLALTPRPTLRWVRYGDTALERAIPSLRPRPGKGPAARKP
jgi:hypothetical protein